MFAGSMFAGEVVPYSEAATGDQYLTMPDMNLTAYKGGTVQITVTSNFAYYMSAFQADFGTWNDGEFVANQLPGGLTMNVAKGTKYNVPFITEDGEEDTFAPSFQKSQANTRVIGTIMETNYWDPDGDGTYEPQGVVKWAPGEYNFMKVTLTVPADFAGGDVAILLAPTSGSDNNPDWPLAAKTNKNYYVCHFTVDQATAPDMPTITFAGEETTTMTVTVTAAEGCTLVVNGEAINANTYTYEATRADIYTAGTVTCKATAVKDGLSSEEATGSKDWVVAELPTAATPVINFNEVVADGVVTGVDVEILNYTDYNINGEPYRATVAHYDANYTADQELTVNAKNDPGYPYKPAVASATYTLKKLEPKASAPATIDVTEGDDAYTITVTGDNVTILVNGEPATSPIVVNRNDYDPENPNGGQNIVIVATTQTNGAEGEYTPTTITETVFVPNKPNTTPPTPTQQTQTPDGAYKVTEGQHEVVVTITPANENQTVYYRIIYTDNNGNVTTGAWTEYVDAIPVTQDGHYRVEFYATEEGYLDSETGAVEFYVTPETGISEIANGKTVAAVRYFNMAGQEMQEANGMTIVVTTYTDGTTSAVKVMK